MDPPDEDSGGLSDEVTRLLERWSEGDQEALEKLIPLVEKDLRLIARSYFRSEDGDQTWQPTDLVQELYLRLDGRRTVQWKSSQHFFCEAAGMMRRLMVDRARRRRTAKRGGGDSKQPLNDEIPISRQEADPEFLIDLDRVLEQMERNAPRQAEVVKLKLFAGLTIAEIARTLKISPTTVKRYWRLAQPVLKRGLRGDSAANGDSPVGRHRAQRDRDSERDEDAEDSDESE